MGKANLLSKIFKQIMLQDGIAI